MNPFAQFRRIVYEWWMKRGGLYVTVRPEWKR
jgi:hypothetical protein